MDQVAYEAGYGWMKWAIDMTWLIWIIVGPLIVMRLILRFLLYANRKAKQADFDDYEQVQEKIFSLKKRK
jgi:hypothetical protein